MSNPASERVTISDIDAEIGSTPGWKRSSNYNDQSSPAIIDYENASRRKRGKEWHITIVGNMDYPMAGSALDNIRETLAPRRSKRTPRT
jgi:hypothetical protein